MERFDGEVEVTSTKSESNRETIKMGVKKRYI